MVELINVANEDELKEYVFRIYLSRYPNMSEDNFISFQEFYEEIKSQNEKPNQTDNKNKTDLINEIKNIEQKFKRRRR